MVGQGKDWYQLYYVSRGCSNSSDYWLGWRLAIQRERRKALLLLTDIFEKLLPYCWYSFNAWTSIIVDIVSDIVSFAWAIGIPLNSDTFELIIISYLHHPVSPLRSCHYRHFSCTLPSHFGRHLSMLYSLVLEQWCLLLTNLQQDLSNFISRKAYGYVVRGVQRVLCMLTFVVSEWLCANKVKRHKNNVKMSLLSTHWVAQASTDVPS